VRSPPLLLTADFLLSLLLTIGTPARDLLEKFEPEIPDQKPESEDYLNEVSDEPNQQDVQVS
jgi:hypothetical protein